MQKRGIIERQIKIIILDMCLTMCVFCIVLLMSLKQFNQTLRCNKTQSVHSQMLNLLLIICTYNYTALLKR